MGQPGASVDTAKMRSAATTFDNEPNVLNRVLQTLESELAPLRAKWTGEAASIFNGVLADWQEDIQGVFGQLHGMADDLRTKADAYDRGEQENVAIGQGI